MTEASACFDAMAAAHQHALEGTIVTCREAILRVGAVMAQTLANGNKILTCGNGGSACDAMHFAGECVGRFVSDRRALPAMALTADPGIITAIGNDYGFEQIFARQVEAHGQPGDMLIGISTSGQSRNVLLALEAAKAKGVYTILLTGEKGKHLTVADEIVAVPSSVTAHIQEMHIFILQSWIALSEQKLF